MHSAKQKLKAQQIRRQTEMDNAEKEKVQQLQQEINQATGSPLGGSGSGIAGIKDSVGAVGSSISNSKFISTISGNYKLYGGIVVGVMIILLIVRPGIVYNTIETKGKGSRETKKRKKFGFKKFILWWIIFSSISAGSYTYIKNKMQFRI